jgi:hypothetical protein
MMKVKCLDCEHVGYAKEYGPSLSEHGDKTQISPACAKCKSENITRVD